MSPILIYAETSCYIFILEFKPNGENFLALFLQYMKSYKL